MKFNEFEKDARKQLAERRELTDDQLDEILPAIAAIARVAGGAAARGGAALARGAAKVGGAAARGAGKLAARGAKSAIKTAAKSIGGREPEEEPNDPNATVGGQEEQPMGATGSQGTQGTSGTKPTGTQADPVKQGNLIKLPAGQTKKPTNFKVTNVKGDDVEIENPMPKPGEPKKFTYKKQDLEGILGNETK
jgi:hypothetical protein